MTDDTKKTLTAVGVGVGATSLIATAMYFLGGREAPKLPSFGELTGAAKREIGFGAVKVLIEDLPEKIRNEYAGSNLVCRAVCDEDTGNVVVSCTNVHNGTSWKDHWKCHKSASGHRSYSLEGPYGS